MSDDNAKARDASDKLALTIFIYTVVGAAAFVGAVLLYVI